jgi:hypothetical protein
MIYSLIIWTAVAGLGHPYNPVVKYDWRELTQVHYQNGDTIDTKRKCENIANELKIEAKNFRCILIK